MKIPIYADCCMLNLNKLVMGHSNHPVMFPKTTDGMANRENSDQTAHYEQSDLGLHCLRRYNCPSI